MTAGLRIVVFGLSVSSTWGNGHATLWRALIRALARRGHSVQFFERDMPYYARHRDVTTLAGGELVLYADWRQVRPQAARSLGCADVGIVTSFCPDGVEAADLLFASATPCRVFYDLDTPVTLSLLDHERCIPWLGPDGLDGFDLVLSFTGGPALDALRRRLGARRVAPLYGSVDPDVHRPAAPVERFRCDLSYLGTWSVDRQPAVERLFLSPARHMPERRFVLAGAQYPPDFPWTDNLSFVRHLPPHEHGALFAASRLTLNVTRAPMAAMGWCPSGRLFEAAACGAPLLSDPWPGLDAFFTEGSDILIARDTADVIAAIGRSDAELRQMAACARARTLAMHTADQRAAELEQALETAHLPVPAAAGAG